MGIRTLLKYLLGNRQAILDVAAGRGALVIGAFFVFAAGLARHYDGVDLRAQPWFLLLPFAVSIPLSLTLFTLVRLGMRATDRYPGFARAYLTFLRLFWMTAPIALLYAVPYERFLSPPDAVRARLWTIGIVSAWRIVLVTRVLAVVMEVSAVRPFFIVMALADGLALAALSQAHVPVLDLMGGIGQTESERLIAGVVFLLLFVGFLSGIVWVGGAIMAIATRKMAWQLEPATARASRPLSRPLKALAVLLVLAWTVVLPMTQPAQRLRVRAEKALREGRITEALSTMSAHGQGDYPPQWDPPPRPGYGEDVPPLLAVVETAVHPEIQPWVRAIYLKKIEQKYLQGYGFVWNARRAAEWSQALELIQRLPEGPQILRPYQESIEHTRAVIEANQWVPATAPASQPATTQPAATRPAEGGAP